MAASNELPQDESLGALWDRFLIRLKLDYIKDDGTFDRLLDDDAGSYIPPCLLTLDELKQAHKEAMAIDSPSLSPEVKAALRGIRAQLAAEGVVVSDRRWKQSVKLLRAAAWLEGDDHVFIDHLNVLRFALWSDDAALEAVADPRWKNPRSWTDFRVKMVVFPALAKHPGAATEKLCRDYLALSDEEAKKLGPPLFEEAGRALLAVSPKTETALELMTHRLQLVRGQPGDMRADLALIQKESARASAIIRNLSRFSRQQGSTPTTVHLSDVIDSVVELRQRRLQEQNISLTVQDAAGFPVTAVFTELQQVLLNFMINAEQAVGPRGPSERRIAIRTRDAAAGVRLEVEDSGPGIPPEHESKLFQPFFTTKPIGEGTGLGLSVSYGIIRHTGGTIGYVRSDGGGAIFNFELPARTE